MMGVAYITPANIKATTIALPPQLQTATRSSLLDAFKRLHPATRHYNGHNDAAQRERTWNITMEHNPSDSLSAQAEQTQSV